MLLLLGQTNTCISLLIPIHLPTQWPDMFLAILCGHVLHRTKGASSRKAARGHATLYSAFIDGMVPIVTKIEILCSCEST